MKIQSPHDCPCPRYFWVPGVFCGYLWSNERGSREEASGSCCCLHSFGVTHQASWARALPGPHYPELALLLFCL